MKKVVSIGKRQDVVIPRGAEILLVASEDDRITVSNETSLNLRVAELGKDNKLPKGLLGRCGVLFILSVNLNGEQRQELVKRAVNRCSVIFIAHTHKQFEEIFRHNFYYALGQTDQLSIKFDPVRKEIKLTHGFLQFAPPDLAGKGQPSFDGHLTGKKGTTGLGYFINRLITNEDELLPSIILIDKYWTEITATFDRGTKKTMARAWRQYKGIIPDVRENQAMYEVILYFMQQKNYVPMSADDTAASFVTAVRKYFDSPKSDKLLQAKIEKLVQVVQWKYPNLRLKLVKTPEQKAA